MQAMQYTINFSEDYDMQIIKDRVKQNGYKTDNFEDLLFKAYLITENESNSYAPLYVWKRTECMTKFIFGGFFDNMLGSFGWKCINIGITHSINLSNSFASSKYALEEDHDIPAQESLLNFVFDSKKYDDVLGQLIIYNPDKWKYVTFYFFKDKPAIDSTKQKVYEILHVSLGNTEQ